MPDESPILFDFPSTAEAALADSQPIERKLPVVPLINTVLFPHMLTPLFIGRERSVAAIEEAMLSDRSILAVAQRETELDEVGPGDLFEIGVEAIIQRILKMPDGSISVVVQGRRRMRMLDFLQERPFLYALSEAVYDESERTIAVEAMMRAVLSLFERVAKLSRTLPDDAYVTAMNVDDPGWLADLVASTLPLDVSRRQEILEIHDTEERLRRLSIMLTQELDVLELESRIHTQVQKEVDRSQREFFLREQLKAIQRELGQIDPLQHDLTELRERIAMAGLPERAQQKASEELERLEFMPPASPEYSVVRTYIDWLLDLPWSHQTEDLSNLRAAAATLEQNHYGLPNVKDRILEFLAARQLAGSRTRSPILCFAGPPGVGKTSLGRSIAEALGRRFVRLSLGGIHDEAEIRGHRRTYIGSMPGRIIKAMKDAGSINPVFVLDEIDKVGSDFRGDPSAALLEVLDPEQNSAFSDHYLDLPYDLSRVMFITTANLIDPIPPALRDRMEIIHLPGYTEDEKVAIAQRFLVPRQLEANGLAAGADGRWTIDDSLSLRQSTGTASEGNRNAQKPQPTHGRRPAVRFTEPALRSLVRGYTHEAGVRNLEREIGAIYRKIARRVAEQRSSPKTISPALLCRYLGSPRYTHGIAEEHDAVGTATGLSWTANGGDIVIVEVMTMPGKGELLLTGQLGDVMRESARAALSIARAHARRLEIGSERLEGIDIHIHVPEGAVPKDGPSAGITIVAALISALTNRPVRRDLAMTGEITLRGRVLAVGGIKEKVLGAHRAGIATVVLPESNRRDLEEVPARVRRQLQFFFVQHVDQALDLALHAPPPAADEKV
jgi:ATP-dependent Lon protease